MKQSEIIISERTTDKVTATIPFDVHVFIDNIVEGMRHEAGSDHIILREPPRIEVDEYGGDEIQAHIEYDEAHLDFEEIISQAIMEMLPPEKEDETENAQPGE